MKTSRIWLVVPLLAVALVACQPAAEPPAEEPTMDTEAAMAAIDELRTSFVTAFNAQDAAGVAATFTEDAVLMPPGQDVVTGRDAIQADYEQQFSQGASQASIVAQQTEIADGWAWEQGTATIGITAEEGAEMVEQTSKYIVILEWTDDGSWHIARDIWNETPPMMETGEEEMGEEEGSDEG